MELSEKIRRLTECTAVEMEGEEIAAPAHDPYPDLNRCVTSVVAGRGRRLRVLKILLSNICENDCAYCAFRAGRDSPRMALTPDELARGFIQMHTAGLVEGLFLSSGIHHNAVREMDRLLATVEILRHRYAFYGYIHLKILPGAELAQVDRAIQLADRVSINLEAPNATRLERLSRRKSFDQVLWPTLISVGRLLRGSVGHRATSLTTQFVVGAAGEADREILHTVSHLYMGGWLARAYYSPFSPIPDTPLEDMPATSAVRQRRLYQSDFLLRHYRFPLEDLPFDSQGNVPLALDPKLAWAQAHPEWFPIELNRAEREELLRVPGIGPAIAARILKERLRRRLTDMSQLRKIGVDVTRAAPFVLLDGRFFPQQLPLWRDNGSRSLTADQCSS